MYPQQSSTLIHNYPHKDLQSSNLLVFCVQCTKSQNAVQSSMLKILGQKSSSKNVYSPQQQQLYSQSMKIVQSSKIRLPDLHVHCTKTRLLSYTTEAQVSSGRERVGSSHYFTVTNYDCFVFQATAANTGQWEKVQDVSSGVYQGYHFPVFNLVWDWLYSRTVRGYYSKYHAINETRKALMSPQSSLGPVINQIPLIWPTFENYVIFKFMCCGHNFSQSQATT